MNYQLILILSCFLLKCSASNNNLRNGLIRSFISKNASSKVNYLMNDVESNKITCRCNICVDAFYCLTDGACFISSKYNKNHDKVYTQGCIDKGDSENSIVPYFCRQDNSFPETYERHCCYKNLCNGNSTIPYEFDDVYSTENIYLLASVCAVIFLTLIAFILFFSCRLDVR